MIRPEDCEFLQWRSVADEAGFFAHMGHFFASVRVRRECGGYPLNDSPLYRWFVVRKQGDKRVLGFISIEERVYLVHLHNGYLRADARGYGLFRELRRQVLDYIDRIGLACTTRVPQADEKFWAPHGFQVLSRRGAWVALGRNAHGARNGSDEADRGSPAGGGQSASGQTGGSHQPDTPARA